jgi:hypothetical protein
VSENGVDEIIEKHGRNSELEVQPPRYFRFMRENGDPEFELPEAAHGVYFTGCRPTGMMADRPAKKIGGQADPERKSSRKKIYFGTSLE